MNAVLHPKQVEFINHEPENFILIENETDGTVLIRAARNNFSERRKIAFIHEMAAEGFIPDHLQWFSDSDTHTLTDVKWVIDHSWVRIHSAARKNAKRLMVAMLMFAGSLWLILMGVAIMRAG